MAVKKSSKTVLDYDPLSWLKDESASEEAGKVAGKQAAKKSPAKKKSTRKKAGAAKSVSTDQSASAGGQTSSVGKVSEASNMPDEPTQTSDSDVQDTTLKVNESQKEDTEMTNSATDYFVLENELTMKNVAEVKEKLDELMQDDSALISIDTEALRKVDSAGLQLLYSLQKSLAKNGTSINWKQKSDVIDKAAEIIGMDFDSIQDGDSNADTDAEQGFGFF